MHSIVRWAAAALLALAGPSAMAQTAWPEKPVKLVVGFTAGSEGSALRGDMYVPSQTVQSLIAAGIQAFQQFQKGGNGNL